MKLRATLDDGTDRSFDFRVRHSNAGGCVFKEELHPKQRGTGRPYELEDGGYAYPETLREFSVDPKDYPATSPLSPFKTLVHVGKDLMKWEYADRDEDDYGYGQKKVRGTGVPIAKAVEAAKKSIQALFS